MGFGVWGLEFGVWGLGFGVWGLGFGVRDATPASCTLDSRIAIRITVSNLIGVQGYNVRGLCCAVRMVISNQELVAIAAHTLRLVASGGMTQKVCLHQIVTKTH